MVILQQQQLVVVQVLPFKFVKNARARGRSYNPPLARHKNDPNSLWIILIIIRNNNNNNNRTLHHHPESTVARSAKALV